MGERIKNFWSLSNTVLSDELGSLWEIVWLLFLFLVTLKGHSPCEVVQPPQNCVIVFQSEAQDTCLICCLPSIQRNTPAEPRGMPPGVRFHQRIELGPSPLVKGCSPYYCLNTKWTSGRNATRLPNRTMSWRRLDTSCHSLIQLWQIREQFRWLLCTVYVPIVLLYQYYRYGANNNCLVSPGTIPLYTQQGNGRHTMYGLYTTVIVLIYFMPLGSCHDPSSFFSISFLSTSTTAY